MITIRRLAQGMGFKYLTDGIAKGPSDPEQGSALTRYYAATGCPPGRWMGAGVAGLGLEEGGRVTDEHLERMLNEIADPVTGKAIGKAPQRPHEAGEEDGKAAKARKPRAGVAGFDLTFSPAKSVSVAWALGDEGTQALIYECHLQAIEDTLRYAEEHYFRSRSGKGGVAQEEIEGVVAASFTHYDSRDHDPDLHDHCVVWNRAQSASDGKWRTLDSRGLYYANQALSTLHAGILADYLTEALGWGWDHQETKRGMEKCEVEGVPERLMEEFSQRTIEIEALREQLIEKFRATYGREPTPAQFDHLDSDANHLTRAAKEHKSLESLTADWRDRAEPYVGPEPASWVATLAGRNDLPALREGDLSDEMLAEVGRVALRRTSERRSTFRRSHVETQVNIELMPVHFASPADRIAATSKATNMALDQSLQVSVNDLHHVPERWESTDGASKFRPVAARLYTTEDLLEAEGRLFTLAERHARDLAVNRGTVAQVCDRALPGKDAKLGTDQALVVEQVATSGQVLDVLVGPAGTGKTTTLAALRAAWEAEHGAGSVVGLAPSATAAQVLGDELGIPAENTAKWLFEGNKDLERRTELASLRAKLADATDAPAGGTATASSATSRLAERAERLGAQIDRWQFKAGQLVIVDEASLAGTFVLDKLTARAAEAGAKIVLTGDPAQLSSVEAGGMFKSLARCDGVAELTEVRRFEQAWEAKASKQFRGGDQRCLDAYFDHGRVVEGDRESLLEQIYKAWKADGEEGKVSLMIAGDGATVAKLNARARADRVAAGQVAEEGLGLHEGTAGVGDLVVTRENARLLSTGKAWVKNGDTWVVTATHADGSMAVKRAAGGGSVVLPADYVAEHVELAYAATAYRVQGRTVQTTHSMISPTTTLEVAYVGATRGIESNILYVDTHWDPDPDSSHQGLTEPQTARDVLRSVLERTGADVSATDTIRGEQEDAEHTGRLYAEHQTIAGAAMAERWDALLRKVLAPQDWEAVDSSDAIGPLHMALLQAQAAGLDIDKELPDLSRNLTGLHDVAAGLEARVTKATAEFSKRHPEKADLVAGLFPRASGVTDPDIARALAEREAAMEDRAAAVLSRALAGGEAWTARLGPAPESPALRVAWEHQARTVAAYRDLHGGPGNRALARAEDCKSVEQVAHWHRARRALDACQRLSAMAEAEDEAMKIDSPGVDMGMGL